ncbi:uncharacterized protein ColSpa_00470 [Colletotrichum spaethianum]|uniref:Ankyrin n=1 Tax=Colletotrichum spaethianum TaxID=700344 RepID=A0AA37L5E3_9PEZI|nr:uncharacterized protein ColSpa_00470 [Colletotrichum spaethianum]GKT40289.1 hypothetical protein ColSpa_00470 [Colletotrichum spaethianum]
MHILDFPPELIHMLLYHMALSRGVTRALRLRLPALFETRLLDKFQYGQVNYIHDRNTEHMSDWYMREHHGAEDFWHSYIAYRVRNEGDPQVGRLVKIRQIAEAYCSKTGSTDLAGTIDTLCWMALERAARCPVRANMYVLNPYRFDSERGPVPDPGVSLLSVAAYLGNLSLAKELLEEGHCPEDTNELFDEPLRLAAWAGHADILKLFQEQLPEYECYGTGIKQWRAKTGPGAIGAITGAAIRGDLDMLRLAIYPPSRIQPGTSDFAGFPYGQVVVEDPYD